MLGIASDVLGMGYGIVKRASVPPDVTYPTPSHDPVLVAPFLGLSAS